MGERAWRGDGVMKEPWFSIVCELDDKPVVAPTIRDIQIASCARHRVLMNDILSLRRAPEVTDARHIAMYLSRVLTRKSYPTIAHAFGDMDHSTIMHGCRRIEARLQDDPGLQKRVASISAGLGAATEFYPGDISRKMAAESLV